MMHIQHDPQMLRHPAVGLPAPRLGLGYLTRQVIRVVDRWIERSRQRRALADLNDHLLKDIGITRSEAACEIQKPFWR